MNIGTSFPRISSRLAGALLATLAVAPMQAYAQQAYPSKPIEIIVASSAGGILDTIARAAAYGLERLGQSAVAKNLPGGGGTIATAALARMPGDGYTLGRWPPAMPSTPTSTTSWPTTRGATLPTSRRWSS